MVLGKSIRSVMVERGVRKETPQLVRTKVQIYGDK